MRRLLVSIALSSGVTPSVAATLEQVVQVLSVPAKGTGTGAEWSRVDKLPGMKWKQPAATQMPAGHTRFGSLALERVGNVTVYFIGTRAEAQQATLTLPQGVDKSQLTATLRRLLPSANVAQVRGGCKDDSPISGSAVYKVDLAGARPVFVWMMTGASRAGMETELSIAPQMRTDWNC